VILKLKDYLNGLCDFKTEGLLKSLETEISGTTGNIIIMIERTIKIVICFVPKNILSQFLSKFKYYLINDYFLTYTYEVLLLTQIDFK
jgi:hypothetical protein